MEITVLMENEEVGGGLHAEHGLCLHIRTPLHTLVMDTGASDAAWENAALLGIDIGQADLAVISHGHYDHAGGLMGFAGANPNADIYIRSGSFGEFYHGEKYIGVDGRVKALPHLHMIEDDVTFIDEELTLFSGIGGRRLWPRGNGELTEKVGGCDVQDSFAHEQCLVIRSGGKSLLISGCAHNGILNILDRYEALFHAWPDVVMSGFHMMKTGEYTAPEIAAIRETAHELNRLPTDFYTGHCTGPFAFSLMKGIMGGKLRKLRVGNVISI